MGQGTLRDLANQLRQGRLRRGRENVGAHDLAHHFGLLRKQARRALEQHLNPRGQVFGGGLLVNLAQKISHRDDADHPLKPVHHGQGFDLVLAQQPPGLGQLGVEVGGDHIARHDVGTGQRHMAAKGVVHRQVVDLDQLVLLHVHKGVERFDGAFQVRVVQPHALNRRPVLRAVAGAGRGAAVRVAAAQQHAVDEQRHQQQCACVDGNQLGHRHHVGVGIRAVEHQQQRQRAPRRVHAIEPGHEPDGQRHRQGGRQNGLGNPVRAGQPRGGGNQVAAQQRPRLGQRAVKLHKQNDHTGPHGRQQPMRVQRQAAQQQPTRSQAQQCTQAGFPPLTAR